VESEDNRMSTIWTPSGEYVPREEPPKRPAEAPPGAPPPPGPGREPTPEELEAALEQARAGLATPVVEHISGPPHALRRPALPARPGGGRRGRRREPGPGRGVAGHRRQGAPGRGRGRPPRPVPPGPGRRPEPAPDGFRRAQLAARRRRAHRRSPGPASSASGA